MADQDQQVQGGQTAQISGTVQIAPADGSQGAAEQGKPAPTPVSESPEKKSSRKIRTGRWRPLPGKRTRRWPSGEGIRAGQHAGEGGPTDR